MDAKQFTPESHLETAEELLDHLILHRPHWKLEENRTWAFRGQGRAEWDLQPNAFRPEALLDYSNRGALGPKPTHYEQIQAEFDLVGTFVIRANEQGLALPTVAEKFWYAFDDLKTTLLNAAIGYNDLEWPIREWMPLFALAQHYGLPTRLLDWTYDPRIAAYFAAKNAAQFCQEPGARLAIWAYCHELVQPWQLWRMATTKERIALIHSPAGQNPNLHAQSGAFTTVIRRSQRDEPSVTTPMNRLLTDTVSAQDDRWRAQHSSAAPVLQKLTLPSSEAPKLLRLLARGRISGTTLFPGYSGVVMGIKEIKLWDR